MPKAVERHTLDDLLVDDRKQLVLQLRPAAGDFVEQHRLGVPDRGGRLQVDEFSVLRHREADQVVEVQERRVVVAVCEAERRGEAREDQRFRRAMRTDEEQRRLRRQRRDDHRLEVVPPGDAERAQQARV